MEVLEIIRSRHSVRQYTDKRIEDDKREVLNALARECNKKSGLNIQIIYDEPRCFKAFFSKVAKFKNCANYISIVGKKSDPDLDEKAGYYGEQLVLKAQELGLNTCWVGFTHGKGVAKVETDEKQVIIIALGYGANQGVAHKNKSISEISNISNNMPQWYASGVEAALLAPTATNQQRFHIELKEESAKITAENKSFAFIDLGIVKYHFEAASGHKCE
ncbi:nitroreductase [Anaerovorax odorimutans]|uniref:Nitroreductase n=1 Tax=Anaerovorax odorimutans TaxID=109327 RepID=A0ABT1RLE0_9FIRM|nr:nitroreductase family protein [Anaerovorax odorimutans]MCQ4635998.1 nitroreductase [Anaerovorax odorimutans]